MPQCVGSRVKMNTKKAKLSNLKQSMVKRLNVKFTIWLPKKDDKYYYSIVRLDEPYAQRKAEKYKNSAVNHMVKSNQYIEASNEGREFLSLGEPIKVGHHSEKTP